MCSSFIEIFFSSNDDLLEVFNVEAVSKVWASKKETNNIIKLGNL